MKKLFYFIAFAALSFVGYTQADVSTFNVAPATQSAISGSIVTFTVTGTNETGDIYIKYVLPKTANYDVIYQNSNIAPINNRVLGLSPSEHDPIFFVAGHASFSITITAKLTTHNRTFPSMNIQAICAADMQISTIFTSAMAEILPIADLMVTNILTGQNPIASGDTVSYLATIQNIGSTIATGITFVSTFPIPMFNVPIATFDGINHAYNYINYPQDFVWSGNYLNNINPGETIVVMLSSPMMQTYAVGTPFSQTAKITTTSNEYTTGNNSAVATGVVETHADLWITKTLAPFTGFHQGDMVTYTITYGNSGGKMAHDVIITDIMNGPVALSSGSFAIGDLPANSGGTLLVTGAFTSLLSSGTTFINTATIGSSANEANMTNNSASATGTIASVDGLVVTITATNITRPHLDNPPYGLGTDTMIQAASGDTIQFTMTYTNNGNTVATHATLKLLGLSGMVSFATQYMSTLPTLHPGDSATITTNGVVNQRNFGPLTAEARLTHDIGQIVSDTVRIEEPMICGDGLITKTEVCDTEGNLGTMFSGQVCENQQGVCVLVTNAIINQACIDYQYINPAGGYTTGQSCSAVNVPLMNSTCSSLTGSVPVETTAGYTIDYTCRGNNTTASTPITITCGNGTSVTGSGNILQGTCSYTTSFVGNAQCIVGSDAGNAACRLPVSESQLQCDLEALDGRIILVDDDGEGEGRFRCETRDGKDAQTISIDCGNDGEGDISATNTSQVETICSYDEDTLPEDKIVTCETNDVVCETENIIIDESSLGYCGDGIREGYEDCDDGDDNGSSSSECTVGCSLKNNGAAMVGCFNIGNNNISIQKGEYLPFRWNLENTKNIVSGNSCDGKREGSIPAESIQCTFKIYDGNHSELDDDPLYTIKKKCNEDNRSSSALFSYFLNQQNQLRSLKNAFGKYFVDSDDFIDDTFGEYKIVLDKVEYDYCRDDEKDEGTQIDRVCSVNFTVTKPYLIQKSSFGITPKSTNDIDIEDFYGLDGNKLISSTKMDEIMVLDADEYEGGNSIQTMMDAFITKYEKLAVKYTTIDSEEGNDITAYKVPGQDIVVFKGNGTLVYTEGSKKTKPFTVIVDGPNLKINGSITTTNAMFLVNKGDITIMPSTDACTTTQIIKGIFVTKNNFLAGADLTNTSLNRKRCVFGGLKVQGILIGGGLENLVQSRRSQLNHWFAVGGNNEASINAERRNEIFNGASVLIEYSPSLRSALPPGASEFTKALEVYKQ